LLNVLVWSINLKMALEIRWRKYTCVECAAGVEGLQDIVILWAFEAAPIIISKDFNQRSNVPGCFLYYRLGHCVFYYSIQVVKAL